MSKHQPTGLSAVMAVDKPKGITSHDCVDRIRRLTKERRVGHAGTLDPAATGLMLICVGPATRLADYLMASKKGYRASIVFGAATDTDDAEGKIISTASRPNLQNSWEIQELLNSFLGRQQQLPPVYSAIKTDGVAAYQKARAGKAVERKPRNIEVMKVELINCTPFCWDVHFVVSKGTYIRALARDIGEAAGSAAHLGALRREQCGCLSINEVMPLDALTEENYHEAFINPLPILGLPAINVSAAQYSQLKNGASLLLLPEQAVVFSDRDFLAGEADFSEGNFIADETAFSDRDFLPREDAFPSKALLADKDCSVSAKSACKISTQESYDIQPRRNLQQACACLYNGKLMAIYRVDRFGKSIRPEIVLPTGVNIG